MTYDPKCAELAEHFLADYAPFTESEVSELAQAIQDAVENWFASFRDERP